LSASQARTYNEREFAQRNKTTGAAISKNHSEWQGSLAQEWKLSGAVESEHFARLSEGQHPHTEEQLVRHQVSRTYEGKFGKEVASAEHRAGGTPRFLRLSQYRSLRLWEVVMSGTPIGRVFE